MGWEKYGALGLFIIALISGMKILWDYMKKREKDHKEERNEWRNTIDKQFDKVEERDEKNYDLLRDIKERLLK